MKPLTRSSESSPPLPYAGLRVVEFSHMVMGPTSGMILADMGAEEGRRHTRAIGLRCRFFPHVQSQ